MNTPLVIEGVLISNPTRVWHELKNSRAHFGPDGRMWLSGGWYSPENGSMCLANMLRFVTHGRVGNTEDAADAAGVAMDEAERLVTVVMQKEHPQYTDAEIPTFNDRQNQGPEGFKAIAGVLDLAAELVKPHAFTHSVTIAEEAMSADESEEIRRAVDADWWGAFGKRKRGKLQRQFREWLDGFEERGWATFWDELAECDTPECQQAKERLEV